MGLVKLCGMRTVADIRAAERAEADFAGLVIEYPASPRSLSADEAVRLSHSVSIPLVAVVVDLSVTQLLYVVKAMHARAIQLSGRETPPFVDELRSQLTEVEVWKVLHMPKQGSSGDISTLVKQAEDYLELGADKVMLDSRHGGQPGGSGRALDWERAGVIRRNVCGPLVLAGGLNPDNVGIAINSVNPSGVDVSTGIESSAGVKDHRRMQDFTRAARKAFAEAAT